MLCYRRLHLGALFNWFVPVLDNINKDPVDKLVKKMNWSNSPALISSRGPAFVSGLVKKNTKFSLLITTCTLDVGPHKTRMCVDL